MRPRGKDSALRQWGLHLAARGGKQSRNKAVVAVARDLRELFVQSADIRGRILECVQQQSLTTIQIAACNTAHEAEPRLARWLLMVQDRTQEDTFQLTQDFLAQMLGARRTTVALAAGTLQHSGFIEYSRGKVKILSREELKTAACDCYEVTQRLLLNLYR